MNILGLQCGYNGGVCVVSNGQIVGQAKTGKNLERGITKKAINGLFILIAIEEKNIRENPKARITELLKKVFK